MTPIRVLSLGLLAACVTEPVPPPMPETTHASSQLLMVHQAGWSPMLCEVTRLTPTWEPDEDDEEHGGRWLMVPSSITQGVSCTAVPDDGGEAVDFTPSEVTTSPVWLPERELLPGTWTLEQRHQGELLATETHTVGDWGQLPPESAPTVADVDGALYGIEAYYMPGGLGDLVVDFVEPMVLRIQGGDGDLLQTQLFVPGEEGLCRVWTGEAELSDDGRIEVAMERIQVGSGVPITFIEPALIAGLNAEASAVHGMTIRGETDTRDLDPLFDTEDGPAPEGTAAARLEEWGTTVHPCTDNTAEGPCTTFELIGGGGARMTEAEVLSTWARGAESLDDLPACGGAMPGMLGFDISCSTVGSIGMGAWFLGLGVVLFRRRRGC